MDIAITVVAYCLTIFATFLGLTGLVVGIGGLFGGKLGALFASFALWLGILNIWKFLEGGVTPMTALIASLVSLFFLDYKNLNEGAKSNAAAEQWGITIVCIYIAMNTSPIRWF
jgi:hypothetical protein